MCSSPVRGAGHVVDPISAKLAFQTQALIRWSGAHRGSSAAQALRNPRRRSSGDVEDRLGFRLVEATRLGAKPVS